MSALGNEELPLTLVDNVVLTVERVIASELWRRAQDSQRYLVAAPSPETASLTRMSKQKRPDRDRRVRQPDRLARILSVLRLIQSRGKWNAKSIARELDVVERTVYRDLQTLEFAGVPWFYDDGAQSYRVRADDRFPVPNLTESEIVGQAVATAITKVKGLAVAGGARPTTRKIAAAAGDDTKQLLADTEPVVCVLGLQLADHSGHQETIQQVQRALIYKKKAPRYLQQPLRVKGC